jgi:hypothetical protein
MNTHVVNFKCIIQKLLNNDPQEEDLTMAHGQIERFKTGINRYEVQLFNNV